MSAAQGDSSCRIDFDLFSQCLMSTKQNCQKKPNIYFNRQRQPSWNSDWAVVLFVVVAGLYCYDTVVFSLFLSQIQNADDVLISPLERFRKEQIGAVKVNLQLLESSRLLTQSFALTFFLQRRTTGDLQNFTQSPLRPTHEVQLIVAFISDLTLWVVFRQNHPPLVWSQSLSQSVNLICSDKRWITVQCQ